MSWIDRAVGVVKEKLGSWLGLESAKDFISEAVAERIREEACTKAYAMLADAHRSTVRAIVWQNALLIVSLGPVYLTHSPWPFYVAYASVAAYSAYSVVKAWPILLRLARTRSVTQTLAAEVQLAVEQELTQRQYYERKVVEWLGPDLRKLANEVARKLRPDVMASVANMAVTLFLAFIAFRLYAIPFLEHKALLP